MNISEEEIPVEQTTLSILPDDCLRVIFLYLAVLERIQMRKVCKRWKLISDDCWRNAKELSVSHFACKKGVNYIADWSGNIFVQSDSEALVIGFIERCAPYITSFKSSINERKVSIFSAMNLCTNIKDLSITVDSKVNDIQLSNWFTANRRIESLDIYLKNEKYKCLQKVSTDCLKKLSIAVLSSNRRTIQRSFAKIVKHKIQDCKSLEYLRIESTGDDEMFKIIGEKTTLIYFSAFFEGYDYPDLTSRGLNNISKLTNLEILELAPSDDLITDTCLTNLGTHCVNLCTIYLSECDKVTDKGLQALTLLPKLKNLEIVCARKITDKYLLHFGEIESLKFIHAGISDAGVIALLRENTCLHTLDLIHTRISMETIKVAAEVVTKRTNNVPLHIAIHENFDLSELPDPLPDDLSIGFD